MVDTNSDPRPIDFVIPANDDASKSIDKILSLVSAALVEGLSDRKDEKDELPAKDAAATEVEVTTINLINKKRRHWRLFLFYIAEG